MYRFRCCNYFTNVLDIRFVASLLVSNGINYINSYMLIKKINNEKYSSLS